MPTYDDYEEARADFCWDLPDSYNPGVDMVRKHDADATGLAVAPADAAADGPVERYTWGDLDARSDALAAGLRARGVETGDRVGVCCPQFAATPLTHLACWKAGAVSVPLTTLFGRDALEHRLGDAAAVAVVAHRSVLDDLGSIDLPALESVFTVGADTDEAAAAADALDAGHESLDALAEAGAETMADTDGDGFDAHDAAPETRTAIMYTSGSTGPPKGVLHSHALWLGRAAAAQQFFEGYRVRDDVPADGVTVWTPADWAWGAALGGTLLGAWHHGHRIVGTPRGSFDPEWAFGLMERFDVTHAFLPPTAIRMLMSVDSPAERWDLSLSAVGSAGEPLTPEILTWSDEALPGVSVNEFYGQTELNLAVGNNRRWFEPRPGSMGKPFPGYDLELLDPETREPVEQGGVGEIALRPWDRRVVFEEYWNQPDATAAKTLERTVDGATETWFLTGDLATRDGDGYVRFRSRDDDVILTAGYRVGPLEVERVLLDHPDVEQAGVVGVPDETRGEVIRAYVQPVDGLAATEHDRVRQELRGSCRERLAEYEYPRDIEFVEALPTTSTGKIRRKDLRENE
ncbi:MAG: AMP-binding protein [Haloglomus sp.]